MHVQVNAAVAEKVDWEAEAKDLDSKSPLEGMDHVSVLSNPGPLGAGPIAWCLAHHRPRVAACARPAGI